VKTSISTTLEN